MKNKGCAKFVACVAVVGERENGRARGRHARGVSFWLACVASVSARACYAGPRRLPSGAPLFLVPTTSKRLLRRLIFKGYNDLLPLALVDQLIQRSCRSTTRLKHGLIDCLGQNICKTLLLTEGPSLRRAWNPMGRSYGSVLECADIKSFT